eukprot:TRINITY_DN54766_c0_g1_i1.p1 TRINITY_DN54766_c0_g1~~TRINITY_DN54766_c0_g1_i1.p1  ORF type:complete len:627 (+),score=126.71 TRINITY_DN54766_c0_g1_i1:78-1958(+)
MKAIRRALGGDAEKSDRENATQAGHADAKAAPAISLRDAGVLAPFDDLYASVRSTLSGEDDATSKGHLLLLLGASQRGSELVAELVRNEIEQQLIVVREKLNAQQEELARILSGDGKHRDAASSSRATSGDVRDLREHKAWATKAIKAMQATESKTREATVRTAMEAAEIRFMEKSADLQWSLEATEARVSEALRSVEERLREEFFNSPTSEDADTSDKLAHSDGTSKETGKQPSSDPHDSSTALSELEARVTCLQAEAKNAHANDCHQRLTRLEENSGVVGKELATWLAAVEAANGCKQELDERLSKMEEECGGKYRRELEARVASLERLASLESENGGRDRRELEARLACLEEKQKPIEDSKADTCDVVVNNDPKLGEVVPPGEALKKVDQRFDDPFSALKIDTGMKTGENSGDLNSAAASTRATDSSSSESDDGSVQMSPRVSSELRVPSVPKKQTAFLEDNRSLLASCFGVGGLSRNQEGRSRSLSPSRCGSHSLECARGRLSTQPPRPLGRRSRTPELSRSGAGVSTRSIPAAVAKGCTSADVIGKRSLQKLVEDIDRLRCEFAQLPEQQRRICQETLRRDLPPLWESCAQLALKQARLEVAFQELLGKSGGSCGSSTGSD